MVFYNISYLNKRKGLTVSFVARYSLNVSTMPGRSQQGMSSADAKAHSQRLDVAERLANDIAFAILAPERSLTVAHLAKHLRAAPEMVESILPALVSSGLLAVDNGTVRIAPIDRDKIMPRLEERLPLEQEIARAAALHAAANDRERMRHAVQMMRRCAQVGDIEGYMAADRALERIIGTASGLPLVVEKLIAIKREFRRAWFAYNRLRDLNVPQVMRSRLVDAILEGNQQAAADAVAVFIDYLRKSY
jgi:DNA-binding GntR family transcriptional regulator